MARYGRFVGVALGEVICCRSSPLLCALKVHHVQLRLCGPTIGSLHDTCDKVNATPCMTICVCATECDRLRSASINVQRQACVTPITNEANLLKCH